MGKKRKVGDACNHPRTVFQDKGDDFCRICGNEPIKKAHPVKCRKRFDIMGGTKSIVVPNRLMKKGAYLTSMAKCHAVGISSKTKTPYHRDQSSYPPRSRSQSLANDSLQDLLPPGERLTGTYEDQAQREVDEDTETYAQVNEIESGLSGSGNNSSCRFLPLKPLFFEVPQEEEQTYTHREWLYSTLESTFSSKSGNRGAIVHGGPGTGKTTVALQLVEHSCFGRKNRLTYDSDGNLISSGNENLRKEAPNKSFCQLVSRIVTYHFCQVDYRTTCLVPDMVHSIAAQLCQAPPLIAYRHFLEENPRYLEMLSMDNCTMNPAKAFVNGIIDPLILLHKIGKLPDGYFVLLFDSVGEAESHKCYAGDTIGSFLSKHCLKIPSWLKLVLTVRSSQLETLSLLPYIHISLDDVGDHISRDLQEYITYRFDKLSKKNNNIMANRPQRADSTILSSLKAHLKQISGGCFLFLKLTIDLIEMGHLVIKSSSFKIFPVSLSEVFTLHCNLRFPSQTAFGCVMPILSTCLAALNPLNLLEIYHSVNSLQATANLPWIEFLRTFKNVQGLLVKRLDGTYMFFHSSFRDWLSGRDGTNSKFLCDIRTGHAAIAFRLIRVEAPLSLTKTLDLAHHILKAKLFKTNLENETLQLMRTDMSHAQMQSMFLLNSTSNIQGALVSFSNIYCTNLKVARLLLQAGASPNSKTWLMEKAPLIAVSAAECNIGLLTLLVEFNADINAENENGETALHAAAESGHLQIVEFLIKNGAKLSKVNSKRECAMIKAVVGSHSDVVAFFLSAQWESEKEANISKEDATFHSLIVASSGGDTPIVRLLLDHCKTLNVPERITGDTPLTAACKNNVENVVAVLLTHGANPNATDQGFTPPLIHAVNGGFHTFLELLLQNRANVNGFDELKRTALIISARNDDSIAAEILLRHGGSVDWVDKDGISAIGWACIRANVKTCRVLLQYPFEINKPDVLGRTPLHLAAFSGNEEIIQLLLDNGAEMEVTDRKGIRPFDRAVACNNVGGVQLFLRKGAKLAATTWTMAAGKPRVITCLLSKLLDDGKFFFQNSDLDEAESRFQYALKKIQGIENETDKECVLDLKKQFLMELLKCKKERSDPEEVSKITEDILAMDPEFNLW